MISKKLINLANDVHGALAVIAFTDEKIKLGESQKYFTEEYGLVPLCNSKELFLEMACKPDRKRDKLWRHPVGYYNDILIPLGILLTLSPEENIRETAEELFHQVNDYLN